MTLPQRLKNLTETCPWQNLVWHQVYQTESSPVRYMCKAFEFFKLLELLEIRQIIFLRKRGEKRFSSEPFWIHCDTFRYTVFFWWTYETKISKAAGILLLLTYQTVLSHTFCRLTLALSLTKITGLSLHTPSHPPKSHTQSHRVHLPQKTESLHLSCKKAP